MSQHDRSLSFRLLDALHASSRSQGGDEPRVVDEPPSTPDSNTGCSLRHSRAHEAENPRKDGDSEQFLTVSQEALEAPKAANVPQSAPHHQTVADEAPKARKSRAKATTPEMQVFLQRWFFDWCSVTIPNGKDGKGSRRGTSPDEKAAAKMREDEAQRAAEAKTAEMQTFWEGLLASKDRAIQAAEQVVADGIKMLWAEVTHQESGELDVRESRVHLERLREDRDRCAAEAKQAMKARKGAAAREVKTAQHTAHAELQEEVLAGAREAQEASSRLCLWAASQGLHHMRVGRAPDGYAAGLHYGYSPVDGGDTVAIVRDGHASNMPALILPGADGACAKLAPAALRLLGPVLLARADVSWDHSREGFFDELLAYAQQVSAASKRPAPQLTESGTGRTFYWGDKDGSASVKVYEKDKERAARGKISPDQVDPHLVRVEFRIAPETDKKASAAAVARDEGPGALLGAVHWVRRMVEHIATITGAMEPGEAVMAVTRIEPTPSPRTVEDRAMHGIVQYTPVICAAAAVQLVHQKHQGDWLAAELDPYAVRRRALRMFHRYLIVSDAPAAAVTRLGLDRSRTTDEEAERAHQALQDYMQGQKDAAAEAQAALLQAAAEAGARMMAEARKAESEKVAELEMEGNGND